MNDLRKLATELIRLRYDLRVWTPVVIARRKNYCLFLDREGRLSLAHNCGPEGITASSRGEHVPTLHGLRVFDEAVELTGCTAENFRQARKRLWRCRPWPASAIRLFAAKLRRGWARIANKLGI